MSSFENAVTEIFKRLCRAGVDEQFGSTFRVEVRYNRRCIQVRQYCCCISVYFYRRTISIWCTSHTVKYDGKIHYIYANSASKIDDMDEFITLSRKWFSELFHLVAYVQPFWGWYVRGIPYYCNGEFSLEDIFAKDWIYDRDKNTMNHILSELVTKKSRRFLGRVK